MICVVRCTLDAFAGRMTSKMRGQICKKEKMHMLLAQTPLKLFKKSNHVDRSMFVLMKYRMRNHFMLMDHSFRSNNYVCIEIDM